MSNFITETLDSSILLKASIEMSPEIGDLFKSLGACQKSFPIIGKNAINPHWKNRYADLASIVEVVNETLPQYGLSYSQVPSADSQHVSVATIIAHESGQYIKGILNMVARDSGPQSIGSTITYCKRYALQSMLGLATADEDDDGEQGHGRSANYVNNLQFFKDATAKLFAKKTDVGKWLLDNYDVKKAEDLKESDLGSAISEVEMIGTHKMRFIGLTKELGMTTKDVIERIRDIGGVDSFARLTKVQRTELLKIFDNKVEEMSPSE
tara:strand:+ start:522 stop:1322 length:801 start_codon:yes stop_codon:yes gene_type:complete